MHETVTPVTGRAQLHIRARVDREKLTDLQAQAVLSILRELTSNAVVHGKARTIRIAGDLTDGMLRFSVRDDGTGFDPAAAPGQEEGHFGLTGIRERLRRLGGTLDIQSGGNGTRAAITLQLQA